MSEPAPKHGPVKARYYDLTNRACDLVFEAREALKRGDVDAWNRLMDEAGAVQQQALAEYNAARAAEQAPPSGA